MGAPGRLRRSATHPRDGQRQLGLEVRRSTRRPEDRNRQGRRYLTQLRRAGHKIAPRWSPPSDLCQLGQHGGLGARESRREVHAAAQRDGTFEESPDRRRLYPAIWRHDEGPVVGDVDRVVRDGDLGCPAARARNMTSAATTASASDCAPSRASERIWLAQRIARASGEPRGQLPHRYPAPRRPVQVAEGPPARAQGRASLMAQNSSWGATHGASSRGARTLLPRPRATSAPLGMPHRVLASDALSMRPSSVFRPPSRTPLVPEGARCRAPPSRGERTLWPRQYAPARPCRHPGSRARCSRTPQGWSSSIQLHD